VQLWTAFLQTGWVGKSVLAILLFFSLTSWAVMFIIARRFRRSAVASLVGLFKAGYAEIEAQIAHAKGAQTIRSLDSVERSLLRASRIESARLSRYLPFLATTAAATPFIGLFGTVWGIMDSFANIGSMGTTSITAVAPGISEALINTAAGLFAAIPALLAYNHFVQKLRQARGEMEDFTLEFLNLTERNFM
jgi:biopolymer transport protein TolQ